ncbi:hypothetical protein [Vibrio taketomensis]|uniref:hypothetical protein n=1 Tax=Vibrio taketomensis TaxID=2572923 RepID=UPI001389BB09|nr:hypothetical protein [Vibrio taketomensis]
MIPSIGGGVSTGGGGITGGTSSAKNGDFRGGRTSGSVTFNNNQGSSGSNYAVYAVLAVLLILGVLWLRK